METSRFDFDLPEDRIAQHPIEPRDRSRLLVARRGEGTLEHRIFADLPDLLDPGDVVVRNVSRVVPARLIGRRVRTGGRWEALFLRVLPGDEWEVLATTRGKPAVGESVEVRRDPDSSDRLVLTLCARGEAGRWVVRPEEHAESPIALLERFGSVPLPPYIRKGTEGPGDRQRYQTVYARDPGSVAAPTAGLHFTPEVFRRLAERRIDVVDVTLHVGVGTFRPIAVERIEEHVLHAEFGVLDAPTAALLEARRAAGSRVVAVGTTTTRVLETAAMATGAFQPFAGDTNLFIRPGHVFRGVDALVTNFHLPRGSLLVLVSALAGLDLTRAAYAEAIAQNYRFYSYGDAMLIL